MIKGVFFDVDGTLLPFGSNTIPESALRSIDKLKKNGIKVFVATGKSLALFLNTPAAKIKFDAYLTLNGQLVYDRDFKMIHGTPIDEKEMEILAHIFNAEKIPFEMIGEFSRYINFIDDRVVKNVMESNSMIPSIDKYKGEKIYQITAYTQNKNIEIIRNTMELCKVTSWAKEGIDIVALGGGKDVAIKKLLEILNIDTSEIMAFGDSENDNEMLKLAEIGVAMGNARKETKDCADYVTSDILDDGIEKALKHFKLI